MSETAGWRPIETAPKDGTDILLCAAGDTHAYMGSWGGRGAGTWWIEGGQISFPEATHWMPLPAPPDPSPQQGRTEPEVGLTAATGMPADMAAGYCGEKSR